ncbi:hypothetical protein MPSEU_000767800 [Mayamaea pseudoterrestris]|nr:hypothetical protein MPSEU_000767800 [Mayamaea pseudoterrestris]
MHGRNRSEYKSLQRENAAKLAQKASQWHTLSQDLVRRRREKDDSPTTFALIEKLLTVNPDPIYLWNHRRELLLQQVKKLEDESDDKDDSTAMQSSIWQPELALSLTALQNNPKAYGAWFHRKWTIMQILKADCKQKEPVNPALHLALFESELNLLSELLQADERNFHGWNYRRFIVSCQLHVVSGGTVNMEADDGDDGQFALPDGSWPNYATAEQPMDNDAGQAPQYSMGPQVAVTKLKADDEDGCTNTTDAPRPFMSPEVYHVIQQEFNYSLAKIMENFSNFSAFHYRSKLLPLMLNASEQLDLAEVMATELEMVENAVFTEPDDQTAWWYQNFLFDFITTTHNEANSSANTSDTPPLPNWFLEMLTAHIESLRELVEEVDSRSKWPWLGLLQALGHMPSGTDTLEERHDIINKLMVADPDRKGRYEYMLSKLDD